ncbi:MAG: hypothetical protein ACK4K9_03320 [Bacteroidia bacterium]
MLKKFNLLLIFILLWWACSNQNAIKKKWVVSNVEFIYNSNEKADTLMQNITEGVLKNLLLNNVYDFSEDKKCTISGNNHSTTFNYKLIKRGSFIEFSNDNSSKEVEVENLNENELVLITHNDQSSIKTKLILKPYLQ